jgi:hypothetical protein
MMLLRGRSDDSIGFRQGGGWCRASVIHNFSLNLEIPPRFFLFFLPSFLLFFTYMSTHYSRDPPPLTRLFHSTPPQPLNHFLFNWSDSRTLFLSKNRIFFLLFSFLFFPGNRKNQFSMGIKKNYNNKK